MPCSKRMRDCHKGCLHRSLVRDYYVAREASLVAQEEITHGYATEAKDCPALTFKDWLIGTAGANHGRPERRPRMRPAVLETEPDGMWATFRRIVIDNTTPGQVVSANTLRDLLDAADIPITSRGGYFSQAQIAGLLQRYLDADGFEKVTRSTLETTKGSRILVYLRTAA